MSRYLQQTQKKNKQPSSKYHITCRYKKFWNHCFKDLREFPNFPMSRPPPNSISFWLVTPFANPQMARASSCTQLNNRHKPLGLQRIWRHHDTVAKFQLSQEVRSGTKVRTLRILQLLHFTCCTMQDKWLENEKKTFNFFLISEDSLVPPGGLHCSNRLKCMQVRWT